MQRGSTINQPVLKLPFFQDISDLSLSSADSLKADSAFVPRATYDRLKKQNEKLVNQNCELKKQL
jgi:hypothetical protein